MKAPPALLRLLLWLYPPKHRRAYGEEMWEVVRYRYSKAGSWRERGWVGAEAATDLLWNAAGVWMKSVRRMTVGTRSGWGMDVRFVLRSVRRSPGYAATITVVLAGAVAVTASVFSFVRGTLLSAPTYPDADRVVVGWGSNAAQGQVRDVVSGPAYLRLREGTTTLEALAAFHVDDAVLMEDGRPTVLDMFSVSVDLFDILPVQPLLGRTFDEGDRTSSGAANILVSCAFWRDRLGGDPRVVGRAIPLNDAPHTIVGVLPEGFEFIMPAPVWAPLRDDVLAADEPYRIHYHLFGRLRPGATAAEATRDLSAVMQRDVLRDFPNFRGWSVLVEPFHEASVMAVRPVLLVTAAAVVLVLLVALVNLTTLFRIRTLGRAEELGVRRALGGSAARVGRVLALEAVGLALVGSAVGITAAPALLARIREMVPLWINIPDSAARVPVLRAVLDPWVVGAAVALAVLGALILITPPIVSSVRGRSAAWGGRRSTVGGTRWLVALELALATVLCLGAGLTTRSAQALLDTDVGLRDQGLLTLYFGDVWDRPVPEQVAYFEEVVRQVEAVPGVSSAALIDYVPFQGEDDYARVYLLDRSFQPVTDLREEWRRVSDGLFETAGMRLLSGRSFDARDFMGTPRVAVVNESFATKHYPAGDAVGSYLSTHDAAYRDMEIVGVVADVRANGPAGAPPPMLYVPLQGAPRGSTGLYARAASGEAASVAEAVREAIWAVDPSQPVTDIVPMSELVGSWVAIPRAIRSLVAGIAGFALVLAGLGVFGVVAYVVRSRTAELGVRLALGASPTQLRRGLLLTALPMVALGVGAGLLMGVLAAWAARTILFHVTPADPVSVPWALAAMVGAALLAIYLPARRITGIDPTDAIRTE